MKIDKPLMFNNLSRDFLLSYPAEAARILEDVSIEHVAALLQELPLTTAPAVKHMLPDRAAACLALLPDVTAAKLLNEIPVSATVRLLRHLASPQQQAIISQLEEHKRHQVKRFLDYPATSVGALLRTDIDVLPQTITVADALRRLERLHHTLADNIYIINDEHHLVGQLALGRLITSNHHEHLSDIMFQQTQAVSVHAATDSLLEHPGWLEHHSLPVVERDNTLLGSLAFQTLKQTLGEVDTVSANDPLQGVLSLAGLYWMSLGQLLDNTLSIAVQHKEDTQ